MSKPLTTVITAIVREIELLDLFSVSKMIAMKDNGALTEKTLQSEVHWHHSCLRKFYVIFFLPLIEMSSSRGNASTLSTVVSKIKELSL